MGFCKQALSDTQRELFKRERIKENRHRKIDLFVMQVMK